MIRITSFSALIVGLLLSMPMVFSQAEAGRSDTAGIGIKTDRQPTDRLVSAFLLVGSKDSAGEAASVTVERRDEATQTSTLTASRISP